MIISFEHNFIFSKTRKTGGTSVQVELSKLVGVNGIVTGENYLDPEPYSKGINAHRFYTDNPHQPLYIINKWLEENDMRLDDFLTVTVVRDPLEIAVSRYYWNKKGKDKKKDVGPDGFKQWLFNEYVNQYEIDCQAQYLSLYNNRVDVNVVLKHNNLYQDFANFVDVLELTNRFVDKLDLGTYKSGFRPFDVPFEDHYDKESIKLVHEMFFLDYILLKQYF